jgi:hypothetical protein
MSYLRSIQTGFELAIFGTRVSVKIIFGISLTRMKVPFQKAGSTLFSGTKFFQLQDWCFVFSFSSMFSGKTEYFLLSFSSRSVFIFLV